MTIVATALMGDWQSVRHDPCTEASLFHHPELLHTYTSQINSAPANISQFALGSSANVGIQCEKLNLSLSLQQHLSSTTVDVRVYPNIVTDDVMVSYGCEVVNSCPYCSSVWSDETYSATPTCLHLRVNSQQQCLEKTPLLPWHQEKPHPLIASSYMCTMRKSHFTYCLQAQPHSPDSQTAVQEEEEEMYIQDIHQQSVGIVEGRVDLLAARACREVKGPHCHWNPSSSLTHRHCEDCPPICRQKSNYLEFSQFTIAAALLLIAVPVARVPITSIISDMVTPDQQVGWVAMCRVSCYLPALSCLQGAVMGLAQALNAVARSIGPLWCMLANKFPLTPYNCFHIICNEVVSQLVSHSPFSLMMSFSLSSGCSIRRDGKTNIPSHGTFSPLLLRYPDWGTPGVPQTRSAYPKSILQHRH